MCGRHADIGPIIPTVYSPDILELILAHATAARRDDPHEANLMAWERPCSDLIFERSLGLKCVADIRSIIPKMYSPNILELTLAHATIAHMRTFG